MNKIIQHWKEVKIDFAFRRHTFCRGISRTANACSLDLHTCMFPLTFFSYTQERQVMQEVQRLLSVIIASLFSTNSYDYFKQPFKKVKHLKNSFCPFWASLDIL